MNSSDQRRLPRGRRYLRYIAYNCLAVVILFLLIEGLASSAYFVRDRATRRPPAERLHTRYDAELGWANVPDFEARDFYGPGANLRINGQGFRNRGPITAAIPTGRTRLVCSGDSFTLGYGVDDGDTWCAQLETLCPQLQTVNLGQGGYGVGQSYLWYVRDGRKLDHHVHLFTFITQDFLRMMTPRFLSYQKPLVRLVDDELVATNVPVPRTSSVSQWLYRTRKSLLNLASVRVGRRLAGMSNAPPASIPDDAGARRVAGAIFGELSDWHRRHGSVLVLVHLPMVEDCTSTGWSGGWRKFIRDQSQRNGWTYVDVIADFQGLPAIEIPQLYLQPGEVISYPGAAGHFNSRGNRLVAEMILNHLKSIPDVAALLQKNDS